MEPGNVLYTIGHSNHPIGRFLGLLQAKGVSALADVRSHPVSRFNPQYNRAALETSLEGAGVAYLFLGRELGARTADPDCIVEGRVSYTRLANSAAFRHGLATLREAMAAQRVALMCAEKDPLSCHRTILVARHLFEEGVPVAHILADGALESHEAATARLLRELGLPAQDLHRNSLISEAYRLRGERIAWRPAERSASRVKPR
jgi:uncharacterized protein (DUF488 family)